MRCAHSRFLLHLHREGELSRRQHTSLEHHIAACPACALIRAEMDEQSRIIEMARHQAVSTGDAALLTARIVAAATRTAQNAPAPRRQAAAHRFPFPFRVNSPQIAFASMAVALIAFFCIEYARYWEEKEFVAMRYTQASGHVLRATPAYAVPLDAPGLPLSSDTLAALARHIEAPMRGGRMIITADAGERLADLGSSLPSLARALQLPGGTTLVAHLREFARLGTPVVIFDTFEGG